MIGFGAYKVSKAISLYKDGGVSISTAGGDITAGNSLSITNGDLGLPDYPGAKHSSNGMRRKNPDGSLITATFTTSGSVEEVTKIRNRRARVRDLSRGYS